MRLATVLGSAVLSMAGLQASAAYGQDVGGWLPLNAGTGLAVPPVAIERRSFGSGQPHAPGYENAVLVENNIYHAPQYLPGYPTAASIWARVIDVACRRDADAVRCTGYNWSPSLGRGEYLYFRTVLLAAATPMAAPEPPPVIRAPSVNTEPTPLPPRPYRN